MSVGTTIFSTHAYLEPALDHPPTHQPLRSSESEEPGHPPADVCRNPPPKAEVQQRHPVDHP